MPARWVLANTWAIVTAISLHGVTGQLLGFDDTTFRQAIVSSVVSVALGAPIIGSVVGWAQGRVLRRAFPTLKLSRWILRTIGGAALVLILGSITSRFGVMATFESFEGEDLWSAAQRLLPGMLWPIAVGFAVGALFSWPQSTAFTELHRFGREWIFANAAGWSLGMSMTMVALGMGPPDDLRWVYGVLVAALLVTGAAVGLFGAAVLRRLNHV